MTRNKTAKVHKTSYAERVLGAMTQIQKEHRKHAIHMATLRAQVRKNAEAKRDTMGPHWSQWVGKAVQKLTDEGVIEHTSPQEVTFTPEGKSIITSVKKALPDQDDLWHRVSTTISRGTKRRRSSTGLNREDPSISASKRLRSVSTMRTSAPQSPVRPPRKSYPTVTFRDTSPLTDVSESEDEQAHYQEENARLRSQLRGKENEIEELRNRVAILTQQQAATLSSSRHATPGPSLDSSHLLGPPPTRPEMALRQVGKGITRTQSGSIIPNISKQPTPAPSDSGDDEIEAGLSRGDTPPLEMDMDRATVPPGTMLTPSSSSSPSQPHTGRPMFQIEGRESDPQPRPSHDILSGGEVIGEVGQQRLAGRVGELERLLGEKETLISDLQITKEGLKERNFSLQEEIVKIRSDLAEDTEMNERANSDLRAREKDISILKQSLTSLQAERDGIADRLLREQHANLGLRSTLSDGEREREAIQVELDLALAKISELTSQLSEKDIILVQSEASLATTRAELELYLDRIRELETSTVTLQQDLEAGERLSRELHEQLEERIKRIDALQADLENVESSNQGLVALLTDTRSQLSSVQAELINSQRLASAKDQSLAQTVEKLATIEMSKLDLEKALQVKDAELQDGQESLRSSECLVANLKEDVKTRDKTVHDLSGKLADAEQRVSIAEESLAAAETRSEEAQQELDRKILALQTSVDLGGAEIHLLSSKLAEVEMQLEEAKGSLVGARAEGLQMKMELESEKRRFAALGDEKLKADEIIGTLKHRIAELTAEGRDHLEIIAGFKACIDDYRQSQIISLDDLVKKVNSVQPNNLPSGV